MPRELVSRGMAMAIQSNWAGKNGSVKTIVVLGHRTPRAFCTDRRLVDGQPDKISGLRRSHASDEIGDMLGDLGRR